MNRFSRAWAAWVSGHRKFILLLSLALLAIAPLSYHNLYHDNSNENFFLENDPNLLAFYHLIDLFGDPEYLIVGLDAGPTHEDVFNADSIQTIASLTEFLENHRYVSQVRSLSQYQYTHDNNGVLTTDDLFENLEALQEDPQALERARSVIQGEDLAMNRLLTADLKHSQIIARTTYVRGENRHKVEIVQELLAFVEKQGYRDIQISGTPTLSERFETLTKRDMAWLTPIMAAVILCMLVLVFRSFTGTLSPLIVVIAAMTLITSLQGLLRFPFTAVNSALAPTVIILSMGTAVHVLVEFFQFRRGGEAPLAAVQLTIAELFFPVFFTCITTSAGFIALSVTHLKPVQEFALLAAVAPMIIFLLCMSTLPVVLSYIREIPGAAAGRSDSFIERILQPIPDLTWKWRYGLAALGAVVTLFSLYSASAIKVDSNVTNYFKKGTWINESIDWFNQHFKGINNMQIIVDTGEVGGVKNPDILRRVEALHEAFDVFPETGKPLSIVNFYKQINRALHEDQQQWFTLPDTRQMAAQLLLLYANTGPNEDLSDLKDFNEQYLRLQIPVLNMDESRTTRLIQQFDALLESRFADLNLELTGPLRMYNAQNVYINHGMFQSFGIAILIIGCCFILLFRSLKYGIIALLPSIVPILATAGLVSMAGIPMDLGTMIVGAMTIGLAVDDAIHLMSRYLCMRRRGHSVHEAIRHAVDTSGRAVLLTSIILISGFSIMLMGSFVSYTYVGLFSAMIMSFALLGDLILLPALLYLLDHSPPGRKREKQTQSLKTIPLKFRSSNARWTCKPGARDKA